ncbi:alternative oxidase, mitochondrial-like isoform X1 [Xenia sp. Carnegie-2017]|uniref:alternative oxidase, mitochondrial-like isoform X1 n=1 Tax=Xenia sp. Carnegie-2017 TaxID=2897299 RepID=UPI001F04C50A|nr:alternative oxidase, mitochondrial-like isoform X1 [Xenia sp. Carnegie-2017]
MYFSKCAKLFQRHGAGTLSNVKMATATRNVAILFMNPGDKLVQQLSFSGPRSKRPTPLCTKKCLCTSCYLTSNREVKSGPVHFTESIAEHPLSDVEKTKEIIRKSKDYVPPHPIWAMFLTQRENSNNRFCIKYCSTKEKVLVSMELMQKETQVYASSWRTKHWLQLDMAWTNFTLLDMFLKIVATPRFGLYGEASDTRTDKDLQSVAITHKEPEGKVDKLAYFTVQALRLSFDGISMYKIGKMTESKWLTRIILLETVAGVPGMVGAMTRHFHSLRRMRRDHGWIHTLLEEAENERMHLMTALELKKPNIFFRGMVLMMQGVFVNMFFISYLLSPRFCHRFVGYLEEEAVRTYTHCIEMMDSGALDVWNTKPAPLIAKKYWRLKDNSTMRDVILAIRADEAHHRKVNHTFASMHLDEQNPFEPWEKNYNSSHLI